VAYGINTIDTQFQNNWQGAKNVGIVRGAYQFFRMKHDPVTQAQILLNNMGPLQPGDLPPVIDVETDPYDDKSYSQAEWTLAVGQWIDEVEAALGVKPIIYTAPYFWNDNFGAAFSDHPLWIAHWGASCPMIPGSWSDWVYWQTSDSGTISGINGPVDTNKFNGSLKQLQSVTW
jgi:lysozyme